MSLLGNLAIGAAQGVPQGVQAGQQRQLQDVTLNIAKLGVATEYLKGDNPESAKLEVQKTVQIPILKKLFPQLGEVPEPTAWSPQLNKIQGQLASALKQYQKDGNFEQFAMNARALASEYGDHLTKAQAEAEGVVKLVSDERTRTARTKAAAARFQSMTPAALMQGLSVAQRGSVEALPGSEEQALYTEMTEQLKEEITRRLASGELKPADLPGGGGAPAGKPLAYATEADADKAFKAGKLKVGDKVVIGGKSGTWE